VRLTEEEAALLHAAPVLDPLIEKFDLLADAGGITDDARQSLKSRLTYALDKKTKLITITTKGRTPDAAQALGSSAIVFLLKELQIKGQERILLEKTIAINVRAIEVAEDAIESIQRGLRKGGGSDVVQESAIKNLAVINIEIVKKSQENEALRQKLEPKGVDVFVQEFSLPQRKASPKRSSIVLLAVLASGFMLLAFVFIRKAWHSAAQKKDNAQKIALIKKAFQFK
jgi:hypothetical protein